MASSMVIVPVPLSVAPDPPSHESKCAESITYSFGNSVPGMVAIVLKTGPSPRNSASASTSMTGFWLLSARRKTRP